MYHLAKFIRNILLKVPIGVCLFLGKAIGLFFYYHPRKRRVAFKNIKSAFPKKTRQELLCILKKSFQHFGLSIVESLILPRIYKYLHLKEEVSVYPDAGIFVAIHAGNWQLSISYWANRYKLAVFLQEQKHKALDGFLNEMRKEEGIHVCLSLKEFIKALRESYMAAVMIDHGAEKDALNVEFFSQEVPTPKGAVYLAKKFNKKIYITFCRRIKDFSHVLEIGRGIDVTGVDDKKALEILNKIYEDYLRKYPWEYYWYYKRFKHKTNRDVLVLTDGKLGHLKQSHAMLKMLKEEKYKIRANFIEVRYKNKFSRIIADILAVVCPRNWLACGFWLSALVAKKTWHQLDEVYADIVISTGSSIAPINKMFSSYLGAKSAVILRPNMPLRKFDLAVIPEHDRVYADNAVCIKGALFYPDGLKEKNKKCRDFFNFSAEKKISFFLGGPLTDSQEFLDNLKAFIIKLKEFTSRTSYKILVSTSRRTPKKAENYLEACLKNFKNTESFVLASRDNYDFIFEGFVSSSDIVFVSNESISMISEIASLKKPCVCVSFEAEDDKHKVFLDSLKGEVAFLKKPYDISLIKPKESFIFETNKSRIKKEIGRLL